jgi:hypothetical protein
MYINHFVPLNFINSNNMYSVSYVKFFVIIRLRTLGMVIGKKSTLSTKFPSIEDQSPLDLLPSFRNLTDLLCSAFNACTDVRTDR